MSWRALNGQEQALRQPGLEVGRALLTELGVQPGGTRAWEQSGQGSTCALRAGLAAQTAGLWLTDIFSPSLVYCFYSRPLEILAQTLKASLVFFFKSISLNCLIQGLHSCLAKFPVISSCPKPGHSISVWPLNFQFLFWAQSGAGHKPGSWPWTQNQWLDVFCPSVQGLLDSGVQSTELCWIWSGLLSMGSQGVGWIQLSTGIQTALWKGRKQVLVTRSCPALCHPVDCSLPGSSVHGDSWGKNPGVGCHFLLQGIFLTQGSNPGLLHCRWILYCPVERERELMCFSFGKREIDQGAEWVF